jgi:tetratricopeptide (TPR) repeat protein
MSLPPPAGHQTPEQPAAIEPGFEDAVQAFWDKNRRLILLVCAAALLAVVARYGWEYMAEQKEQGVQSDFARAADRPEQLANFAKDHEGHPLSSVAWLRIADQRYAGGDYRQALENYNKAMAGLKNPALLSRARLGVAMSQYYNGDKAAAEATLKAIGADAGLPKAVRAESVYHLASLAHEAGNTAEVERLVAEIGKIDPAGIWSQRATGLVVRKPAGL